MHPYCARYARFFSRSFFARYLLAFSFAGVCATSNAQLPISAPLPAAPLPATNLPIPQRIGPLDTDPLRNPVERLPNSIDLNTPARLQALRSNQVSRRLHLHRDVLETDPMGQLVVKREILAWAPSRSALAAARAAGLAVIRQQSLDGLDQSMVVLRVPDHAATADMLHSLRKIDPSGVYDFNHVYTGSSANPMNDDPASAQPLRAIAKESASKSESRQISVGLIDSGVDTTHTVFREVRIHRWGCNDAVHPSRHGTAVAALMVGQSTRFRGVLPHATLYAADIYCDSPTGGSADKIAAALAWFAKNKIAVINLSLVGPPNQMLERVVGAMLRRGHLLVAAVGNDGPAAPPLYPASYPGVVGVAAVDAQGRMLPESGRGPQVMFAAPGSQMVSASPGAPPYRQVRGTSYAAPIVAALLAATLSHPDQAAAQQSIATLARQAAPAGRAHNHQTGYGIVGESHRIDAAWRR